MANLETQLERMEHSRKQFNDILLENSSCDDKYQAILEWDYNFEIDVYGVTDVDYSVAIHEIISSEGRPDLADKLVIHVKSEGSGECICGKNNLRRIYYIRNSYNDNVLKIGSECVKKTFKDGSIVEDIEFIDKCLRKHKDFYKKKFQIMEKQYKELETDYKELETKYNILKKKYEETIFFDQSIFKNVTKQHRTYSKIYCFNQKIHFLEKNLKKLLFFEPV